HVILVIDDPLEVAGGHVEDEADARGHALEEPDVRDRHGEFDMPHALAADAGERHFDTATITDNTTVLDAFILAAGAFPVLDRTEDAFAEQAAFFGLERAIIDRFGVLDLAFGPGTDGFRRGDRDRHVFHLIDLVQPEQFAGAFFGADHTI